MDEFSAQSDPQVFLGEIEMADRIFAYRFGWTLFVPAKGTQRTDGRIKTAHKAFLLVTTLHRNHLVARAADVDWLVSGISLDFKVNQA